MVAMTSPTVPAIAAMPETIVLNVLPRSESASFIPLSSSSAL
jgi:hypothetical protein